MIYIVGIFWALFFVAVLYGLWKYIPKSACNQQLNQLRTINARIAGASDAYGSLSVNEIGQKSYSGCFIEHVEIFIGERCAEGAFSNCHITICRINLHPNGPGMKAFNDQCVVFKNFVDGNHELPPSKNAHPPA